MNILYINNELMLQILKMMRFQNLIKESYSFGITVKIKGFSKIKIKIKPYYDSDGKFRKY